MTTEEKTYKVTFHLIDGTKLKSYVPATASEVERIYALLGEGGGRIKFPTEFDTMQYLPASSVLRIEAKGEFE